MSGYNNFDSPINWDVGIPTQTNSLIFDSPTKIGACVNNPTDNIAIGGSDYIGLEITPNFDSNVMLYRNTQVTCADGNNYDFCFGQEGITINNALYGADNTYGIVTNQLYSQGIINFTAGQFDVNNNNGYRFVSASDIFVADNFDTVSVYEGCSNHHNSIDSNEGGLFTNKTLTVEGDDFLDCVYSAPNILVDTLPSNGFYVVALPTNANLELQDGTTSWTSGNNIGGQYELSAMNSGSSFEMINATLIPAPSNPAGTMKFFNNQTFGFHNNSDATFRMLWAGTGATTDVTTNSVVRIYDLFFDRSSGTTVDISSSLLFDDTDTNGVSFAFNPSSNYNMENLTATSTTPSEFTLYPTDFTSDYDYPTQDLYLINMVMSNNLNGGVKMRDLTTTGTTGLGKSVDYYPNDVFFRNVNLHGSGSATWYIAQDLHANNYTNLDTVSGTITGDMNYTNVYYTNDVALTVNGNINLNSGGNVHELREQLLPSNNTITRASYISFDYSEEFGVDGYECEVDEATDNFTSPISSWRHSDSNYSYTTENLTISTQYAWRCKTYKTDIDSVEQQSGWKDGYFFSTAEYSFTNICFGDELGIDVLDGTVRTETIQYHIDIPVNYASFGHDEGEVYINVTYFDGNYNNSDYYKTQKGNPTLPSYSLPIINSDKFDVPFDTNVSVKLTAMNSTGAECNTTYSFAVEGNQTQATGLVSLLALSSLALLGVVLVGLGLKAGGRDE